MAPDSEVFNILVGRLVDNQSDSNNNSNNNGNDNHGIENDEYAAAAACSNELEVEAMEEGRVPLIVSSASSPDTPGIASTVKKSIGWLGSTAIAVNALASPAILQLPATFQESGLIPTTITLILVGILSAFCSLHMANVVSKVPHNRNFERMVEFSEPFRVFWGNRAFVATQIVFFLCTVCLNTAGIVDTAQVLDTFLGHSTWGSVGIRFHPVNPVTWHHGPCTRELVWEGHCDPFGDNDDDDDDANLLLTAGYVIAAAVLIPACLADLKENVMWQIFGFFVLCVNSMQFVLSFAMYGIHYENVPLWGNRFDRMIGVILFNFSLVVAIPSWLHEKKDQVKVPTVVFGASFVATVLYILVGAFGALAIPHVNNNVLEPMVSGAFGQLMRVCASFFAFVNIGLDIPLFSVLARYNLVNSGLCNRLVANALVVFLPWCVSWMFYQGNAIEDLLSWGGVLFTGFVAFILPLSLSLYTLVYHPDCEGSIDIVANGSSRRTQIVSLTALLVSGISAVVFALMGLL